MDEAIDIARIRKEYSLQELDESHLHPDPFHQFRFWFQEAVLAKVNEPNAMHLATTGLNGRTSGRIVLLKEIDEHGFQFFTNYESQKAKEIEQNPWGSLTFFWAELERQVRIEGKLQKLPSEISDAYFQIRPREAQLGAWASAQSRILESRHHLEQLVQEYKQQFEGQTIPRPPFWGGYRLVPDYFEFWQGRLSRLHDRLCYRHENNNWKIQRLFP
ncbi:MAG: pyridoxamine 5'-phosphate oxidase [Bacteroidia bacterium]|nr:pyridoxamine 5'-phosphate oxidase [Bacteroidia bacterium]